MRRKQYDIVIIGSGAGGGVAAKELSTLCKEGLRIALLEWGPKLGAEEYTGDELEMARRLMFDNGGLLTKDGCMTWSLGKAYGGSTTVYTGTSFIMPERILQKWGIPGMEYADLRRRSLKYFEENNVHDLEETKINENNRLFKDACKRLGYSVGRFPINVKGCRGSGLCNLGCPNGAKQGTNIVQLPAAEENGVEVVTNCRVEKIADRVCHATVSNPDFGIPSAWEPGEYEISAKIVVVCAGGVQTPALLLRSGFGRKLPALGRYVTCHPALILVGQHEEAITNFHGFPKTYYSDHFAESKRFILETCMYYPLSTAKSLVGFGDEHAELMSRMDRLQMIIAMALDEPLPRNRIEIDGSGRAVVNYVLTGQVMNALFEAQIASAQIMFESGVRRLHSPAGVKFFIGREERKNLGRLLSRKAMKRGKISLASAHPMGGCRMGTNPAESVTDAFGRVHGVPWLFVADASLFPRCSEVNPYITVMALADRVAEHIRNHAGELLS